MQSKLSDVREYHNFKYMSWIAVDKSLLWFNPKINLKTNP